MPSPPPAGRGRHSAEEPVTSTYFSVSDTLTYRVCRNCFLEDVFSDTRIEQVLHPGEREREELRTFNLLTALRGFAAPLEQKTRERQLC